MVHLCILYSMFQLLCRQIGGTVAFLGFSKFYGCLLVGQPLSSPIRINTTHPRVVHVDNFLWIQIQVQKYHEKTLFPLGSIIHHQFCFFFSLTWLQLLSSRGFRFFSLRGFRFFLYVASVFYRASDFFFVLLYFFSLLAMYSYVLD